MSYPAGNKKWAWEWMGFHPPQVAYADSIDPKYQKFRHCFDDYHGIGTFEYWKRKELEELTESEKIELVRLLKSDQSNKITKGRKYLGIKNGKINKDIDPYADGRTNFFSTLNYEECAKLKIPHNARCREKDGYHCDDCNTFIKKGTDEYARTEGLSNYKTKLHNIRLAYYHLQKPEKLKQLSNKLNKINPRTSIKQIQDLFIEIDNYDHMSKYVDQIVRDIRENPTNWVRYGSRGLQNGSTVIHNCGNGSKFLFLWATSVIQVFIRRENTDFALSFWDKYKLEEAVQWWMKNATLEMMEARPSF